MEDSKTEEVIGSQENGHGKRAELESMCHFSVTAEVPRLDGTREVVPTFSLRESGIELSEEDKAGPLSEATVQKLINAALAQQKRAAKTDER